MAFKSDFKILIFTAVACLSFIISNAVASKAGRGAKHNGPIFPLPEGIERLVPPWAPEPKPRSLPVGPLPGGTVVNGFQLTLQPVRHQVEVTQPIQLEARLSSNGVDADAEPGDLIIEVKDDKGADIPPTRFGMAVRLFNEKALKMLESSLKKGEVRKYPVSIHQEFDMSLSGSYFVTVKKLLEFKNGPGEVVSNTVQIDIFPTGKLPRAVVSARH